MEAVKISLANDHRGFLIRSPVLEFCREWQFTVCDHGTFSGERVDYPLFAKKVAADLRAGRADFGILLCCTGTGMAMAANRFPGVRAVVGINEKMVALSRRHNHANVLCMGECWQGAGAVMGLLETFFGTGEEAEYHGRRVAQMDGEN
jgi:ribose 5-phosphate isomerase B